jgi:hypothetical protein
MRRAIGRLLLRLARDASLNGSIRDARLAAFVTRVQARYPILFKRCCQREIVGGAVVCSVCMILL